MTELEFNPSALPDSEILVYQPIAWGLAGELRFNLKKNGNEVQITSKIDLGFKLFIKKAFNIEALSIWKKEGRKWSLNHSIDQINPIKMKKESIGNSKLFDPISGAYCLRANPFRKVGEKKAAEILKLSGTERVLIEAVAEKQQELPVFGPTARRLFEIKLTPSGPSKINFAKDVQILIDAETNIVVEAFIKFSPFGRAGVRLVKLTN